MVGTKKFIVNCEISVEDVTMKYPFNQPFQIFEKSNLFIAWVSLHAVYLYTPNLRNWKYLRRFSDSFASTLTDIFQKLLAHTGSS